MRSPRRRLLPERRVSIIGPGVGKRFSPRDQAAMDDKEFKARFLAMMNNQDNRFHPLVWINGTPEIGPGTYIGGMSEVNAKGARVVIGRDCDIASFVAINVADSHLQAIGLSDGPDLRDIVIGHHVFVGSHSAILGGAEIGHHSVVAAGTVVRSGAIPPYSLVSGNPMQVRPGYYRQRFLETLGYLPDENDQP
jgi:acetyltransferase-like isoleucine patch superfamily enzyme